MSYNKFINNSYCVGGKHYSPTTNIHGEITNTGIQMGRPVHTLRTHISKNPRMIAATAPDIIKFVHQGKGLYKAEGLREGLSSKGSKAGSKAANTSNTNRKARTNGKGLYLGKIH